MVMLMSYSRVVSVVFILWGVGPFLRNGSKSKWHCSREVKCQQDYTLHKRRINCSRTAAFCVFVA